MMAEFVVGSVEKGRAPVEEMEQERGVQFGEARLPGRNQRSGAA